MTPRREFIKDNVKGTIDSHFLIRDECSDFCRCYSSKIVLPHLCICFILIFVTKKQRNVFRWISYQNIPEIKKTVRCFKTKGKRMPVTLAFVSYQISKMERQECKIRVAHLYFTKTFINYSALKKR